MSAYTCPDCGGSFPFPIQWEGGLSCPWCYNKLLRHHQNPKYSLEQAAEEMIPSVVSTVRSSRDDRPNRGPISRMLFGEESSKEDKEDLVERLQRPGYEFVVEEWKPYGTYGPPSGEST